MFNYWNNLFLGSVETYFLEVGAFVSVKRAPASVSEGRFYLIWLEIAHFFKYRQGGVEPKNFFVECGKWIFLRLSRIIFFGSQCICVCEKSHCKCLRGSFFLHFKTEKWDLKLLLLNYLHALFLGSVETYFLVVGAYGSVKRATTSVWEVHFW